MKPNIFRNLSLLALALFGYVAIAGAQSNYHTNKAINYFSIHWYDSAFIEFQKGEAAGETNSADWLAFCYIYEKGTPQNFSKATALFEKWYTKSRDICARAILFYATEDAIEFANPTYHYERNNMFCLEPNLKMCLKYARYYLKNYKKGWLYLDMDNDYKSHEISEQFLSKIQSFCLAYGKGGEKRNIRKAIEFNEGDKSYNKSIARKILSFLRSIWKDGSFKAQYLELSTIISEYTKLGINLFEIYNTDLPYYLSGHLNLSHEGSTYNKWNESDVAKINQFYKTSTGVNKTIVETACFEYFSQLYYYYDEILKDLDIIVQLPNAKSCVDILAADLSNQTIADTRKIELIHNALYAQGLYDEAEHSSFTSMIERLKLNQQVLDAKDSFFSISRFYSLSDEDNKEIASKVLSGDKESVMKIIASKTTEELTQIISYYQLFSDRLINWNSYYRAVAQLEQNNRYINCEAFGSGDEWNKYKNIVYQTSDNSIKQSISNYNTAFSAISFEWSIRKTIEELDIQVETAQKLQDSIREYVLSRANLNNSISNFRYKHSRNKQLIAQYDQAISKLNMVWTPEGSNVAEIVEGYHKSIEEYLVVTKEIKAKDKEFEKANKKLKEHYLHYIEERGKINTDWNPEVSITETDARIERLKANFNSYQEFLILLDLKNSQIIEKAKPYKKLIVPYVEYFKTIDKVWKNEETIKENETIANTQDSVMSFLDLLISQDLTHNEIVQQSKNYKQIFAPYIKYYSEFNRTWTQDWQTQLERISALQEKMLKILQLEDLKTLNKQVKKEKIDTVEGILSFFSMN